MLRKNNGSFFERAIVLVRVMVFAVASDAALVPEVFPNARDANDPDGRDIQVPIYAHEGVTLSSGPDAMHDLPNDHESMPYQGLAPQRPPNGQDTSSQRTNIQEPIRNHQPPVEVLSPIHSLSKYKEHPLEGQSPMSIFH